MKRTILSVLVATGLTGCYQTTSSNDIQSAAIICGGLDRVESIYVSMIGTETVVCDTRMEYLIHPQVLQEAKETKGFVR